MKKSLTDILSNGQRTAIADAWATTEAADDLGLLPAGEYTARLLAADLFNAKSGTPGVNLLFAVLGGEHAGRRLWHDLWLTPAALPMTKRDLLKLGIDRLERLEQPVPAGIRCKVKLALRKDDDGTEYNRVRSFAVVGIDEPAANPFAPPDAAGGAP